MPDYSGIGAFAGGAIEGSDAALSRYATIEDMRRRREQERRIAQSQALQSLIQGATLASQHPDVAESAVNMPDQELLPREPVMAGVGRARTVQGGAAKFARAMQTGDFDENDPEIGAFVSTNVKDYGPMLNSALGKKRLLQVMRDPAATPDMKARAMADFSAGEGKPDVAMFDRAYPSVPGALTESNAAGTARGTVQGEAAPLPPGVDPSLSGKTRMRREGALAEAEGTIAGQLKPQPLLEPGQVSGVRALNRDKSMGERTGTNVADLVPMEPGGDSPERLRALARETPADKAWKEANAKTKENPPIHENEKMQILADRLSREGFVEEKDTQGNTRVYGPGDLPELAGRLKLNLKAPREINGVLLFNPRPYSNTMATQQERDQHALETRRQWVGKKAIIGVGGAYKVITDQDVAKFFARQLGPRQ